MGAPQGAAETAAAAAAGAPVVVEVGPLVALLARLPRVEHHRVRPARVRDGDPHGRGGVERERAVLDAVDAVDEAGMPVEAKSGRDLDMTKILFQMLC